MSYEIDVNKVNGYILIHNNKVLILIYNNRECYKNKPTGEIYFLSRRYKIFLESPTRKYFSEF